MVRSTVIPSMPIAARRALTAGIPTRVRSMSVAVLSLSHIIRLMRLAVVSLMPGASRSERRLPS